MDRELEKKINQFIEYEDTDDDDYEIPRDRKEAREKFLVWFSIMGLPEEKITDRVELAFTFYMEFLTALSYAELLQSIGEYEDGAVKQAFKKAYETALSDYMDNSGKEFSEETKDFTKNRADEFATMVTKSTDKFIDEESDNVFSESRAEFMAETEAEIFSSNDEFNEAIAAGYKRKTWNTVGDLRVRDSHVNLNGRTIPIQSMFTTILGNTLMYPCDTENCGDMADIANCRCWLTYS